LVGLLPGMSSGAASVLALLGTGERDRGRALATLSAAGAGAAVITAAAFVLVGRARSGAMLAVQEVVAPVPWEGVVPPMLLAVLLLGCAAGIAVGYVATLVAGKAAAGAVDRVPYPALCAAVLTLLAALVGAATGPWGLAVVGAAAVVGLVPWRLGVRRSHLMGCTMLPLIASLAG
jgi:putative membrane protein